MQTAQNQQQATELFPQQQKKKKKGDLQSTFTISRDSYKIKIQAVQSSSYA